MTRLAALMLTILLPAMGMIGCAGPRLGGHVAMSKPYPKSARITTHGQFLGTTHLTKQTFGSGNGNVVVTSAWRTDAGYHLTGETVSCFLAATQNTVGSYCQKVVVGSQPENVNTKQISFAFTGIPVGAYYIYTYSTGTISDATDPNLAPLSDGTTGHCANSVDLHQHHHGHYSQ